MLGEYLSGIEAKYRIQNYKYPYKHDIIIHTYDTYLYDVCKYVCMYVYYYMSVFCILIIASDLCIGGDRVALDP